FVDHRAHTVFGFVAVEDLDFVTILEIHAAVATGLHDQELDVEAEVAVGFFGDDVGRAVFAAVGDAVVGHYAGAAVDGVGNNFPLDGHVREEAGTFPVFPLLIEGFARAVDDDVGVGGGFSAD